MLSATLQIPLIFVQFVAILMQVILNEVLESNVIRTFCSIYRNHCEIEQAKAEALFVFRQAILDSEPYLWSSMR